jgi:hypothetical protein
MLEYLVPGKSRRRLLELLWRDGESGSVSQLARLAGLSFSGAHRELQAMGRAGLAVRDASGGAPVFRANTAHPEAELLKQLLSPPTLDTRADEKADAEVRGWLVDLGALLDAPRRKAPSPERALAAGARLSHRDPSVARVLPALIWKHRHRLDRERLVAEARRFGERQALGLFLEIAAELGRDPTLAGWADSFRDRRVRAVKDFFETSGSPYARQLAERHTPPVARRWHYRLNMGLDAFESSFRRHAA